MPPFKRINCINQYFKCLSHCVLSAGKKKIIRSDLIKDKWPRKLQFKSQTGGSQNGNVPFREASSRRLSPTPCQYINSGKRRRTVCSEKWLPWLLPWHLDRDLITSQWMILNNIHSNHTFEPLLHLWPWFEVPEDVSTKYFASLFIRYVFKFGTWKSGMWKMKFE